MKFINLYISHLLFNFYAKYLNKSYIVEQTNKNFKVIFILVLLKAYACNTLNLIYF